MAKKRLAGQVDRIEGDTIVVVVKDPDNGEYKEIYAKKKLLKKKNLKEGDDVTVEVSGMIMSHKKAQETQNRRMVKDIESKSSAVTLIFSGLKNGDMAKRFFTYLVDGGLEDQLIQELSGKGVTLEISDCNKKNLTINFQCSKEKPAKKSKKTAPK